MKKTLLLTICCILSFAASAQDKFVGGDISMLKKFIEEGAIYNDKDGNAVQPLAFFKEQGWNAMRVRLFVDPTKATEKERKQGAIQDLNYVIALGKQIKDAGYSFMLDFHYSDTWTDPGQHSTPSAWSSMSAEQLKTEVYNYTKSCLQQLNTGDATPDFIQVGNEITTGMLWPTGKIYASGGAPTGGSWDNFASYLANGIKACNEECPNAKIVIHTELHAINDVPAFYNNLAAYTDVKYDIIGLSYYPDFHGTVASLGNLLTTLESQHADKKIMIVETGYGFEWALNGAKAEYKNQYPLSEEGQKQFANALIDMLNNHPNVNGLYWWYPEYTLNNIVFVNGTEDWSKDFTDGYWNGALFHYKTGKAMPAIAELKSFLGDPSGIETINREPLTVNQHAWYTLDGRKLNGAPNQRGIYIHNGKKMVVR